MFLPNLIRKLKQFKDSLLSLKDGNGTYMRAFCNQFENGSWRGVQLNRTAGLGPVTRERLRHVRLDELLLKEVDEAKHQPSDKQSEEKKSKAGRKRDSKLPPK